MAAKETIIWTALPYARTATTLKLSAYVTFQLTGDSPVLNSALYPTASNYDATKLKFVVYIQGNPVAITPTTTSLSTVNPALWKQLVPSQAPLPLISWDVHMAQSTGKNIVTFNSTAIGAFLTQIHGNHVAASFGSPLSIAQRADDQLIKTASLPSLKAANLKPKILTTVSTAKSAPKTATGGRNARVNLAAKSIVQARMQGTPPPSLETQLIEAHNYFNPVQKVYPKIVPPAFPDIDFHQAMAMVGQHPPLMRLLGVVVDLEIPITGIPASGQIYIGASGLPGDTTWQFPRTVYELGADFFRPAPKSTDSDYLHGFLNMSPNNISLGNADLPGGLLKMMSFAASITNSAEKLTTQMAAKTARIGTAVAAPASTAASNPASTNPPYSRTSGISVYRVDRMTRFLSMRLSALKSVLAVRALGVSGGPTAPVGVGPFYADDLLKGWRPDFLHVGRQGSTWLSVNQRINFYKVGTTMLGPFPDESQLSIALTVDPNDANTQYLHEALFTWHGWSLAVPKPGQPITDAGLRSATTAVSSDQTATAFLQNYVFTHSHYPLASAAYAAPGTLPLLRYGDSYSVRARYADLAGNSSPVTAQNPTDGVTSQTTTYLRQEPIGPPALFPTQQNPGFGASSYTLVVRKYADGHLDKTDLRVIVPALGDVSHAELHGKLDKSPGVVDPTMYAMVKTFDNTSPLPLFLSPTSTTPLPYLPDPASLGACLVTTSDVTTLPVQLTGFYSGATWPNPKFATMTLTAGTSAITTGSTGQNMAVTLAPGQKVNFALSSSTSGDLLADFQQTWALEQALKPLNFSILPTLTTKFPLAAAKAQSFAKHTPFQMTTISKVLTPLTPINKIPHIDTGPSPEQIYIQSFINGRNAALSPPTPVQMVFATQVPEPGLDPGRTVGGRTASSTKGEFKLLPTVHGWSTEELEYYFVFTDEVDNLSESQRTTTEVTRTNRAFSVQVPYIDEKPVYLLDGLPMETYEFHDTKTHTVSLQLVAKSRYTSCFPASWQNDPKQPFTVTAKAPQPVIVPSSRRPDPVAIEAVLPVFHFGQQTSGTTSYSAKSGNTVRVYLRRPWFSSGNGEQLAVILGQDLSTEGELPPHVSLIGTDPAFGNEPIKQFLKVGDFLNRVGDASTGLTIKESSQPVVAALYNPVFDTFHQMWVVDIVINPPTVNAYTPFIRLALARYQVNSLAGLSVSSIAVTDITQLHSSRVATLTVLTPKKVVAVALTASAVGKSQVGTNVVVGSLEEKVGSDPEGGWTAAIDASGAPIENVIPLHEASAIKVVQFQPVNVTVAPKISKSTLEKRVFAPVAIDTPSAFLITAVTPSGPGIFDLPDSSQTYRIVIREYELHIGGSYAPKVMGAPANPSADNHVVGRLVHVDTLAVP